MAINIEKSKPKKIGKKNKDTKRRANWLFRFTLLVILIPLIILAWILLTSLETKGEPIVGERFNNQLNPAISKEQETSLKDIFVSSEFESVQINLKSATLRVNINTIDNLTIEQIGAIIDDAYTKVDAVLPIATYFTNKVEKESITKMYDLEIHVYNYLPTDENRNGYAYMILTKNASAEGIVKNIPSQAIDGGVVEDLVNKPTESEPVGQ